MVYVHNLGFPRIGPKRELKTALENYWNGDADLDQLLECGEGVCKNNWQIQKSLDYVPVGDFSLYDHVLDTSFLIGNLPARIRSLPGKDIDRYFCWARGRAGNLSANAGEMTRWFNTRCHYIVPELYRESSFKPNFDPLFVQIKEAKNSGHSVKPVILGPVSYLWLSKTIDETQKLDYLEQILVIYRQLLEQLSQSVEWVQIDEPILVMDIPGQWQRALEKCYSRLRSVKVKVLLATYFGELKDNLTLVSELPVDGLHIDVSKDFDEAMRVVDRLSVHKVLSLGVVDGRNVWASDLNSLLEKLKPISKQLKSRLWIAPSCSLLHMPVELFLESELDFAKQKLEELSILARALNIGESSVAKELLYNKQVVLARKSALLACNAPVRDSDQIVTLAP